jgi:hypothetical protein
MKISLQDGKKRVKVSGEREIIFKVFLNFAILITAATVYLIFAGERKIILI